MTKCNALEENGSQDFVGRMNVRDSKESSAVSDGQAASKTLEYRACVECLITHTYT